MNEVIIYLIKVIAIQGVLFSFYCLVLRKSARHAMNRFYLLGSLVLAFLIPFIELSIPSSAPEIVQDTPIIYWLSEPSNAITAFEWIPEKVEKTFSWWSLLPFLYGLIASFLVIRSAIYIAALQKLKRHSEPITKRWFTLFKTSQARPFSFFANVFIPRNMFGLDGFRQVLAHECVHVRQLHSVDRLLLDFIVSLFWFNPFIYLYRNALIEIHEYQADEAVVSRFQDPIGYQEVLFSQLHSPQYSGLVSHFNVEMIKKRIVMMNKPKKMSGWVYMMAVPVTLMMIFAFSSKEVMKPLNDMGEELTSLIGPVGDLKSEVESVLQKEDEPSILPLKESDLTRMTSGFGMRNHPITKKKQMHLGTDFSCAVGSDVMATAAGKVSEIQRKEGEGYGNMLMIDHGNGYVTLYAQLSEINVKEDEFVEKGQVIALFFF